jgi:hypothetical protein
MLLQVQREKLGLQEELCNERVKVAMLEQEIAQIAAAAQEMEANLAAFFSRAAADTNLGQDQSARHRQLQGPTSPYGPAALQRIPEQMQKQQGMLDFAEKVKDIAANLQQRLASISAGNTPTAGQAAAAAAAGPFSEAPAAAVAASFCKLPSMTHSTSVASEAHGSMDLPMQALEVSRLALQLHQPQGAGEDTSCYSSSGRKSSCTVLNGSVDLTASINSLRSLINSQHSTATGHGMQELAGAPDGRAPYFLHSSEAARNAAVRCAVTRGAAAIAGQCASIAAAAAASAAANAARKAAAAAAMADRSQERADLRASSESGFSSLTSPGRSSVSGTLLAGGYQRQEWHQADQDWQHHSQHFTANPLWQPSPVEEQTEPGSDSGSRPSSVEPLEQANASAAGQLPCSAMAELLDSNSGSGSQPSSAEATPEAPGAQQQAADMLPRLPAAPAHLTVPQRTQKPAAQLMKPDMHQQQQRMQPVALMQLQHQPQQHHGSPRAHQHNGGPHFRYGSEKLCGITYPHTESAGSSAAEHTAMSAQHHLSASIASKPMQLQNTPVRPAARPSAVGPLHRNLASLGSSYGSPFRAAAPGGALAVLSAGLSGISLMAQTVTSVTANCSWSIREPSCQL